jgi:hypothetical protein
VVMSSRIAQRKKRTVSSREFLTDT